MLVKKWEQFLQNQSLQERLFVLSLLLAFIIAGLVVTSRDFNYGLNEPAVSIRKDLYPDAEPAIESQFDLPDFTSIIDAKEKKLAFFNFMLPFVEVENAQIMIRRQRLVSLLDILESRGRISVQQRKWLYQLATMYRESPSDLSDEQIARRLLVRVDVIPPSLALSQSANESAWGTSRFAREGNNLFGQWCFSPGCGIVPGQRPAGASYEVAQYDNPRQSVSSYIHNLNTNSAYLLFREIRLQMRTENRPLDGLMLAEGLENYSSRGEAYILELQAMINSNELYRHDTI